MGKMSYFLDRNIFVLKDVSDDEIVSLSYCRPKFKTIMIKESPHTFSTNEKAESTHAMQSKPSLDWSLSIGLPLS